MKARTGHFPASRTAALASDIVDKDGPKALINVSVLSPKNAAVWGALDCLYVLSAADSQAARVNWKNAGSFTASPKWRALPALDPVRARAGRHENARRRGALGSQNGTEGGQQSDRVMRGVESRAGG